MTMKEEQSLDEAEFGDVDLSGNLSSIHLSPPPPPQQQQQQQRQQATAPENLTADKLLDELTIPPQQQISPYSNVNNASSRPTYDQFFEEVSLDLPRQQQKEAPRVMKFMPRRGSPVNPNPDVSSNNNNNNTITSSDFAGPFYSISDVLDDTANNTKPNLKNVMAVGRESGDYESIDVNNPTNPRAARRNVNEAAVVATSGGTSIGITRRRSM
jgi:hypothetical protein